MGKTELECLNGGRSPSPLSLRERFERHLIRADGDACWAWRGARRKPSGVGVFQVADGPGGIQSACRVAWVLANGPLLPWQQLEFRCGNRTCLRPDHLRIARKVKKRPASVERYSTEYKQTAVLTVLDGRWTLPDVARGLRVKPDTLAGWVRQAVRAAAGATQAQREQMNGASPPTPSGETEHV